MNNLEMSSFEDFKNSLNEKKEDQQYSSGCLMGYFNKGFNDPKIKKEDLYDNEENEYGLEIEPHVTVLYGLQDNKINEEDIIKLFLLISGPEVSTSKISLFENENFDVVKWDIDSDDLVLLNKMVTSMFPYKSSFPDYHAHVTIAYCLPGKGKDYVKELKKALKKKIDYWVYSKADGKKIKIIPNDKSEVIRETYPVKESIMTEDELLAYKTENELLAYRKENDKSYTYKGYDIKLIPHHRFKDSYIASVYKDDDYLGGIKGPMLLDKCIEWAENLVNNKIN